MSVTIYTNADGLIQKYGTSEAKSLNQGGFLCTYGPYSMAVLNLDLTQLTASEVIQNDVLTIPSGALIEYVEIATIIAAADGTDIDVGLINIDRNTATAISAASTTADSDGLLDAFVTATMGTAGEVTRLYGTTTIPASISTGGARLGDTLTDGCLITASAAGTYTAGKVQLRIAYIPNAATGFGEVH